MTLQGDEISLREGRRKREKKQNTEERMPELGLASPIFFSYFLLNI